MLNYVEHHVVNHCNLKCKGCSHFSCIAKPWFEPLEDFKKDFELLRDVTNGQVATINLLGGEPLLHPQICEMLKFVRRLFPNSQIMLATNGLLIKQNKEELVQICNNYNITVTVSDYGLINVRETLSDFNSIRIYAGKTNFQILSLDLTGQRDKDFEYHNCIVRSYGCNFYQNGKLYICVLPYVAHIFNEKFGTNLPEEEGLDIRGKTEKDLIEYLKHPIDFCSYCNTVAQKSSCVPWGITQGEITEWICQS